MSPIHGYRFRKASRRGACIHPSDRSPGGSVAAKRWVGFIVLATVAILIGLASGIGATATRVHTTTFTLQPGATYCTIHSFDLASGGSVTVTFSATPGTVNQYVMTAAQEQAFFAGSGLADLGSDQSASDTFTTSLPSGGTYYVVSCHGSGYEQTLQVGSHTMTISGIDPPPLYVAIAALFVGVLLLGLGLRSRSRAAHARAAYAPLIPSYGSPAPMTTPPGSPWMPFGAPTLRTLHIQFQNTSAADETLQILLNGSPLATLPVPAGRSVEADLHPNAPVPPGGTMTVEAVSASGQRATQAVVPDAEGRAEVMLRLG